MPPRVELACQQLAEPAFRLLHGRVGVLPDVQPLEVRVHGVRVADTPHERDLAGVEELFHAGHDRVEPDVRIERQHFVVRDPDRRPRLPVCRVGVRDDGVETVVAAAELEDHQHVVVVIVLDGGGEHRLGEDRWHDDADAGCGDTTHHEVASSDHRVRLT